MKITGTLYFGPGGYRMNTNIGRLVQGPRGWEFERTTLNPSLQKEAWKLFERLTYEPREVS